MISKIIVQFCYLRPYCGFETVSRRYRLLQRMAGIEIFSCFNAAYAKITQKLLSLLFPDEICFISTRAFCVWVTT